MTKKEKISRSLFFVSLAITLLGFGFFLWCSLDILINGNPENGSQGFGKALILTILLIYGSIGFGICTIFNIVSYVLQRTSKTSKTWSIITFISIFLPAISEGISLLLLLAA